MYHLRDVIYNNDYNTYELRDLLMDRFGYECYGFDKDGVYVTLMCASLDELREVVHECDEIDWERVEVVDVSLSESQVVQYGKLIDDMLDFIELKCPHVEFDIKYIRPLGEYLKRRRICQIVID